MFLPEKGKKMNDQGFVKHQFPFLFIERLFGKAWREEFVALYEDSSLIWFRDRDRLDPEGGVFLRDAPEMLAAGQVNFRLMLKRVHFCAIYLYAPITVRLKHKFFI